MGLERVEEWAITSLPDYEIFEPPFDLAGLGEMLELLYALTGDQYGHTLEWASQFDTAERLTRSLRDAWSETCLPLRALASSLQSPGLTINRDSLEFGVLLEVDAGHGNIYLQQAPRTRDTCRARLEALFGIAPPSLVDVFAASPGLTFLGERKALVAAPSFLLDPMETAARKGAGKERSIQDCLRADLAVWTRDECACELLWRPSSPARHWVVLAHDQVPFLYIDGATEALSELDLSISDVIRLFLKHGADVFDVLRRWVRPDGRRIPYTQRGDEARERFDECGQLDRAAVGLRALRRGLAGADHAPEWIRAAQVINACTVAIRSRQPVAAHYVKVANSLLDRCMDCGNQHMLPLHLLGYLAVRCRSPFPSPAYAASAVFGNRAV